MQALYQGGSICEDLVDGLELLLCELPVETISHGPGFLFVANADDCAGEGGLSEDPGQRQVNHGFVMVVGNVLEHMTYLFEMGCSGFLGEGVASPEITWFKACQVKAIG